MRYLDARRAAVNANGTLYGRVLHSNKYLKKYLFYEIVMVKI